MLEPITYAAHQSSILEDYIVILPAVDSDVAAFERLADGIPLRRTGGPKDVTDAVLYLLRSAFVTGELLHVTGGEEFVS